jgi:hypothetical protein
MFLFFLLFFFHEHVLFYFPAALRSRKEFWERIFLHPEQHFWEWKGTTPIQLGPGVGMGDECVVVGQG